MNFPVNLWSVLGAVVVSCALMAAWYGPLFGKLWRHLMGLSEEKQVEMMKGRMGKAWGIAVVATAVQAYFLAYFLQLGNIADSSSALQLSFMLWLGFVATVMTGAVSWENKPWKLWTLNAGYYLVSLLLMSVVLVYWR